MLKEILYDWQGANQALFYAVNGINGGEFYEKLMLLGTFLGEHEHFPFYLAILILIALGGYWRNRKQESSVKKEYILTWVGVLSVMVLSYGIDGVLVKGLKTFFHYPRPFIALPEGTVHIIGPIMEKPYTSFPSGHASFAMLMVAGIWPLLCCRLGKITAIVFAAWVGWSRLALGVHFPMDLLTGYTLCLAVVLSVRIGWDNVAAPCVHAKMESILWK